MKADGGAKTGCGNAALRTNAAEMLKRSVEKKLRS
jgi:hypothetical protein